jgi:hypothetical protein
MIRPTEKLDSSLTGTNHSNQQPSKGGIAVVLGLAGSVPYVWIFINYVVRTFASNRGEEGYMGPGYGMFVSPVELLMMAWFVLSPFLLLAALVLGITELGKVNQRKRPKNC